MVLTQALVSGILLGTFYAVIATGFSLIFGVTRVFNLAHGEFVVIGGYIGYWLWKIYGINPFMSIPVSMILLILLGTFFQRILAYTREPYELNTLVLTFGLSIFLQNLMLALWSGNYRLIVIDSLEKSISLGIINTSLGRVFIFIFSIFSILFLHYFMKKTYFGKAMRATSQDRESAAITGINVKRMDLLAFSIGAAMTGAAGPLFASIHYLYPSVGIKATIIALIVTIFAGVGNIVGILAGGIILGVGESLTVAIMGSQWRELASSAILIALLLIRPYGLFEGRRY
ncbi:MAG: branched-chain amino acid ABC transporter permease [Candidatus Hydrothermarchaeota archaeon]